MSTYIHTAFIFDAVESFEGTSVRPNGFVFLVSVPTVLYFVRSDNFSIIHISNFTIYWCL